MNEVKPLVALESPWSGLDGGGPKSLDYLRNCIRDSLSRGEIPWASHGMLAHTRALYEEDPDQRLEGLEINKDFIYFHANKVVFYIDHGMSDGMKAARTWAVMANKPFETRRIYG
jgi:hypothetical protein